MAQMIPPAGEHGVLPRQTVLVVDDIESTRQRLVDVLGRRGFTSMTASSGSEAFDVLMRSPDVDAILLDLLMPGMNGWDFRTQQLRDPRLAAIPTIVITVKPLADHERYALRVGTASVIQKPFDDHQVLDALARIYDEAMPHQTGDGQVAPWRTASGEALFWSRHGQVACEQHIPPPASAEWREHRWTRIPYYAGKHNVEYCCQFCHKGPIRHRSRRDGAEKR